MVVSEDKRQLPSYAPPVKKFWLRHWLSTIALMLQGCVCLSSVQNVLWLNGASYSKSYYWQPIGNPSIHPYSIFVYKTLTERKEKEAWLNRNYDNEIKNTIHKSSICVFVQHSNEKQWVIDMSWMDFLVNLIVYHVVESAGYRYS